MAESRQQFVNRTGRPFYVYVEPNPECYRLETGDELTIIENLPDGWLSCSVTFMSDEEVTIWPGQWLSTTPAPEGVCDVAVLVNGKSPDGLSWNWKKEDGPQRWRNFEASPKVIDVDPAPTK